MSMLSTHDITHHPDNNKQVRVYLHIVHVRYVYAYIQNMLHIYKCALCTYNDKQICGYGAWCALCMRSMSVCKCMRPCAHVRCQRVDALVLLNTHVCCNCIHCYAQITGATIPNMQSILDMVVDSHHKLLPDVPMVGWDVAMTTKGNVLLEVYAYVYLYVCTYMSVWYMTLQHTWCTYGRLGRSSDMIPSFVCVRVILAMCSLLSNGVAIWAMCFVFDIHMRCWRLERKYHRAKVAAFIRATHVCAHLHAHVYIDTLCVYVFVVGVVTGQSQL